MTQRPLVIFGAGDIARIARLYFERFDDRTVVAFCADTPEAPTLEGLPLLAPERLAEQYPPAQADLFIGVGYSKVNTVRAALFDRFRAAGYALASFVHPSVTLWPGTDIGENVFIYENNVIQPGVTLGNNVTLWSNNHIGHDSSLGDHVFVSSEVCIAGNTRIGARCFLGINATIRDGIEVGDGCVVGAGALMLSDAEPDGVYLGAGTERHRVPARKLRGL